MSAPCLCLMGPTASGKTDLAIAIAKHYPVELISVDSAYVYRGLDIGSAKPTAAEVALAPHRLIDICEPNENYSVGRFLEDVQREVAEIRANGNVPLLVGGTMLYFYILQNGMASLPDSDPVVRAKIDAEAAASSWEALHAKLMALDPSMGRHIHANDKQRIQRALELYYLTGKKPSELQQDTKPPTDWHFINMIIAPDDRVALHARIAERFDKMLATGFVEEVETLRARGDLDLSMPSMRSLGYRQVWEYLDGQYDELTLREKGIAATRQFAKRQFTWLRRWHDAVHFRTGDQDLLAQFAEKVWTQISQD